MLIAREHDVRGDRDHEDRQRRDVLVDVAADRERDRRRREHVLDELRHAAEEADVLAERARRVHEHAAGPRQRAGELGVAEDEGQVEDGDDAGRDAASRTGRRSASPRFQPKYMPEMT